ncbi:MAG: hypothetical protein KDA45_01745 [Planctomycetales bacterium]|nr:hypothetical protein [Planctomycetales bacterium]
MSQPIALRPQAAAAGPGNPRQGLWAAKEPPAEIPEEPHDPEIVPDLPAEPTPGIAPELPPEPSPEILPEPLTPEINPQREF